MYEVTKKDLSNNFKTWLFVPMSSLIHFLERVKNNQVIYTLNIEWEINGLWISSHRGNSLQLVEPRLFFSYPIKKPKIIGVLNW